MYLEPMIIEPLFYRFEPLAATHPALVGQLEKLVARGGLAIPPDRMFEMKASEKLNSLNAYVSGFGGSKRVVVWDTTLQKLTTPEILFVFGHEMGHYVLGHIRNSLLWLSLLLLVAAVSRLAPRSLDDRALGGTMAHSRHGGLGVAARVAADRRDLQLLSPSRLLTVTAAGRSTRRTFTAWRSRTASCRIPRLRRRIRSR